MDEYIKRSDAMSVFGDIHPLDYTTNAYTRNIAKIPAADVVERPRWIPVTERLPEKSGNYLTAFGDGTALSTNIFMHPDDWLTEEGHTINPNGKWYYGEVTHWQELPEPPEEDKHGS